MFLGACTTSKQTQVATHKQSFAVSFYSIGAGIDIKAKNALDRFIQEFQEKEKLTLLVEKRKWGKEGEEDYCVDLKSFSNRKRDNFTQQAKQILDASKLVRIRELDHCN